MEEKEETSGGNKDKEATLDSLVGIAAGKPASLEEVKKERLARQ